MDGITCFVLSMAIFTIWIGDFFHPASPVEVGGLEGFLQCMGCTYWRRCAGNVQGGIRQWIASRESLGRIYRNLGVLPCFIIKDEGFPADIDSIPMEDGISIPKSGL